MSHQKTMLNDCPNATEERQLLSRPCSSMIAEDALDLINRQKSEIERLNEKITAKDENNYYFMGQLRLAREKLLIAKSEAIKDFAHLVIDKSRNGVIYASDIPDLVKEKTEADK